MLKFAFATCFHPKNLNNTITYSINTIKSKLPDIEGGTRYLPLNPHLWLRLSIQKCMCVIKAYWIQRRRDSISNTIVYPLHFECSISTRISDDASRRHGNCNRRILCVQRRSPLAFRLTIDRARCLRLGKF